ncbi:2,3-diaminopropionate biosynthesis protein SbnB [Nocardia tengchongensis]|uniref:2,3-diaminopropionate biosynthesis protein SbnB n=1 Tax=Nocardia tengchongensis TaxID=2055889 RepID=UPI0036BB6783
MTRRPQFGVIGSDAVSEALNGRETEVLDTVRRAYELHDLGATVNPPSHFLRFADRPDDRIIALPASIGAPLAVDGIKWISSFPGNIEAGLPRASAVLILNDPATGFPYCCMEASLISAARTAASAALAAISIAATRGSGDGSVGFVGAGPIAEHILRYLHACGYPMSRLGVHDIRPERADSFAAHAESAYGPAGTTYATVDELMTAHDLIVFATVAPAPHVSDPAVLAHRPLVLHVSLRDLAPELLLLAQNLVDDIDHCLRAETSPHLAEKLTRNRDFVAGTLADVLAGRVVPALDRAVVFSPFGLGVLDLAVARLVHDRAGATDAVHEIPNFFAAVPTAPAAVSR